MFPRPACHIAPIRASISQRSILPISQRPWARFASTKPPSPNASPPSTPHHTLRLGISNQLTHIARPQAQFYKTFGRPIAKVFLLAIFTYQLAYYLWVRLEHYEIKSQVQGTTSPADHPNQYQSRAPK
ncbi:hypothetical protein F5B20DRAFT_556178 [Whalleya microplaca]|nr:hypothetical protein F5B20DRAFT_556178 [Whalleya microplaca]